MRNSNHLIGLLNFLTFLLSIPILGGGIWLSSRANTTDCLRFLQWPIIIIGVAIMVISLAGFAGACYRNTFLMYVYLWAMFLIIVALLGFIIFAYVVTDKGSGRTVPNRAYSEYRLEDYSGWLKDRVASDSYWGKIRSCIRDSKVCGKMARVIGGVPESADSFYLRKLNPIQSGCCKPQTECGYVYTNETYWTGVGGGTNTDCSTWNNDRFRWKQTAHFQYTGVVGSHLVSLKQLENGDVAYCFHYTSCEASARLALLDFLNVGICLADMWEGFSGCDSRFAELARYLGGARVLRQDPLECLIQFLCSSNNNIGRITRMVDFVSSLGNRLGTVESFEFYEFPSLDRLSRVSEKELREAGFGYRAKYIVGTVDSLQSKPGGGSEWLASLRELHLQEAIDALSTLPGVGPKVAACIALFSLDQHQAIPVDTHVWQIATRYLIPELAGARLTPKLCSRVADAFVSKYGKYAGWAQTLLFIAELPSQKALLPSNFWITDDQKPVKTKGGQPSGPINGVRAQKIKKEEAYEKL